MKRGWRLVGFWHGRTRWTADVVIGVPDSGLDAALGYAQESGIPVAEGFLKNRYIGRTFIKPEQSSRETAVKLKLSPMRSRSRASG